MSPDNRRGTGKERVGGGGDRTTGRHTVLWVVRNCVQIGQRTLCCAHIVAKKWNQGKRTGLTDGWRRESAQTVQGIVGKCNGHVSTAMPTYRPEDVREKLAHSPLTPNLPLLVFTCASGQFEFVLASNRASESEGPAVLTPVAPGSARKPGGIGTRLMSSSWTERPCSFLQKDI